MAASSEKVWEDIKETLLTCKICEEPFDQQERLPRVLPCQHAFCGPCIARLDKGGQLSCPNCRQNIQVAEMFPVETTRSILLDCTEAILTAQEAPCEGCDDGAEVSSRCLDCSQNFCKGCCRYHQKVNATRDHIIVSLEEAARSPSLLLQKVEMCQKHQDKKLELYCKTCKSAICSSCVIVLVKERNGLDQGDLGKTLEQTNRQVGPDISGLMESLKKLGSSRPVTSQSIDIPTTPVVTSLAILTPKIKLELGLCNAGCELGGDGRTLYNYGRPKFCGTGQSGPRPFAFPGTCGSVDLAQPALHYWTVRFKSWGEKSGDRCEFGLASLQTLDTCGKTQRMSDIDDKAATLVVVVKGDMATLEGRYWTKDVDTPQPRRHHGVTYTCLWEGKRGSQNRLDMPLGFLYDNRQPQSPRVLVVETKNFCLLGVRRLLPCPDLTLVLRLGPTGDDSLLQDAALQLKSGPDSLKDSTAAQLQSLLNQIDR